MPKNNRNKSKNSVIIEPTTLTTTTNDTKKKEKKEKEMKEKKEKKSIPKKIQYEGRNNRKSQSAPERSLVNKKDNQWNLYHNNNNNNNNRVGGAFSVLEVEEEEDFNGKQQKSKVKKNHKAGNTFTLFEEEDFNDQQQKSQVKKNHRVGNTFTVFEQEEEEEEEIEDEIITTLEQQQEFEKEKQSLERVLKEQEQEQQSQVEDEELSFNIKLEEELYKQQQSQVEKNKVDILSVIEYEEDIILDTALEDGEDGEDDENLKSEQEVDIVKQKPVLESPIQINHQPQVEKAGSDLKREPIEQEGVYKVNQQPMLETSIQTNNQQIQIEKDDEEEQERGQQPVLDSPAPVESVKNLNNSNDNYIPSSSPLSSSPQTSKLSRLSSFLSTNKEVITVGVMAVASIGFMMYRLRNNNRVINHKIIISSQS